MVIRALYRNELGEHGEPGGGGASENGATDEGGTLSDAITAAMAEQGLDPTDPYANMADDHATDPQDTGGEPNANAAIDDDEGGARAAPVSWTKDAQAEFDSLPTVVQDEILKREADINAKLDAGGRLSKVLEPIEQRLEGSDQTTAEYVENILGWADAFRTNPATALANIHKGLLATPDDARAAIKHIQSLHNLQPESDDFDFDHDGESRELDELREEVRSLKQRLQSNDERTAETEWDQFVHATDEGGEAKYPYAKEVMREMGQVLKLDPSLDFAGAYAKAVRLNDEVFEKVLADRKKQDELDDVNGKTNRSNKSRGLELPRGRSQRSTAPASTGDLGKDLKNAMREQGIPVNF